MMYDVKCTMYDVFMLMKLDNGMTYLHRFNGTSYIVHRTLKPTFAANLPKCLSK